MSHAANAGQEKLVRFLPLYSTTNDSIKLGSQLLVTWCNQHTCTLMCLAQSLPERLPVHPCLSVNSSGTQPACAHACQDGSLQAGRCRSDRGHESSVSTAGAQQPTALGTE